MYLLIAGINRHFMTLWLGFALLLGVWHRLRGQRALAGPRRWQIAMPLILAAMVALVLSAAPRPDHAEHVHASYLRGLGLVPYTDYFEHHHPTLYFVLGPLYHALPRSAVVSDVAAAISGLLFVGMASLVVLFTRRLWGVGLGLWAVALLAGQLGECQFLTLRPDMAANLLVLASIWVLASRSDLRWVVVSGALLGFAFWFGPKAWPFLLMGPAAVLFASPRPSRWWWLITCHLLGVAIGLGLFVTWLWSMDLLGPFYDWCIAFNAAALSQERRSLLVAFPLILSGLAVAGLLALRGEGRFQHDRLTSTLLAAGVLALVMGVQRRAPNPYDLQIAVLLFAVLGAEPARRALGYLDRRSVLLAAAALTLYFGPFLMPVARGLREGHYWQARAAVTTLIRVAGDEAVVGRTPYHPLVTRDAVDLWHGRQSTQYLGTPAIRQRLAGIGPKLRAVVPPLVIDHTEDGPPLSDALLTAGIVDAEEAARLKSFFAEHYVMRELRFGDQGSAWFWIREDRLPYLASAPSPGP